MNPLPRWKRFLFHTGMPMAATIAIAMMAISWQGCNSSKSSSSSSAPSPQAPATGFSLSGTISTASRNAADGDTNDPRETDSPNNTLADAQILSNPATVLGFLTESATGGGSNGDDRFAATADQDDVFRVTLAAGQSIYLQIADWLSQDFSANDLDLYLVDSLANIIASSEGLGRAEELHVSQGGDSLLSKNGFEIK